MPEFKKKRKKRKEPVRDYSQKIYADLPREEYAERGVQVRFDAESKKRIKQFFKEMKGKELEKYLDGEITRQLGDKGLSEEGRERQLKSARNAMDIMARNFVKTGASPGTIGGWAHSFLIEKELAVKSKGEMGETSYGKPITEWLILHPDLAKKLDLKFEKKD